MKLLKTLSIGVIALSALTYSCGGGTEKSTETTVSTPEAAPAKVSLEDKYKDDPIYIKGLAKLKESDCLSCHMVERKIVGPSYAEVASKYENTEENVTRLAANVINGNVGNWGDVPMPAHPALSQEDAEDMIRYVLLLK